MRSAMRRAVTRVLAIAGTGVLAAACNDLLSSPSVPASIEFVRFAAPAVVVGDTLRDIDGVVVPVSAIVRNQQGDVLEDAEVRFTYADAGRDSALLVDSVAGLVFAKKVLAASGTQARIAARVGDNLQVLRSLLVTTRPDSVDRGLSTRIDTLRVIQVDTGNLAASNVSAELSVVVRHLEGTGSTTTSTQVPNWLVKFEVLQPANPTNDTTKSVFLVNDARVVSNIDTTSSSGIASRFIRVRGGQFPTGTTPDSVLVRATVTYRGKLLRGSPDTIVVPVTRKP